MKSWASTGYSQALQVYMYYKGYIGLHMENWSGSLHQIWGGYWGTWVLLNLFFLFIDHAYVFQFVVCWIIYIKHT